MTRPFHLRSALPEDADDVARLSGELGYEAAPEDVRRRMLRLGADPDQCITVAVYPENKVAGWIHAAHELTLEAGSRVEILGLVVDSGARRQGLGSRLVEAAERWARERGVSRVVVRTNIVREESHPFYLARGYARSKTQAVYTKTTP